MNRTITVALLASTIVLAGCEDGDNGLNGEDGMDGMDGLNSLVATRTIPVGDASCPGGGLAIDSGLDTDRNDTLDAGEVTASETIDCSQAPMLRALHASPDAPAVNIWVNGTPALTGVDYAAGSGFLPITTSTRVQIEAIIPGGNAIVIDEARNFDFDTEHTFVAVGNVADPIAGWIISNDSDQPIGPGNIRAQVIHAAPGAPIVDVYVTAPGADLAMASPINVDGFDYQDVTTRLEVPAGDYQIRITPEGDAATVAFDSGTLSLSVGADLLIAAIDKTGPGASPVQLVVMDGTAANTVLDANTPASVVAVHASPDAPDVDILADDLATAADDAVTLALGAPFTAACEIGSVPAPASYTLNVTAAGDPSTVALSFPFDAVVGSESTAIVTGLLTSTPAIQPIALATNTRSVATETKLRITHAAASTDDVDLYLLPDGTMFMDASVEPSVPDVPFTADTEIMSIEPGIYDVYVTPAGTKATIAIEVPDLDLTAGQVLDIIARDPADDGSEGTLPQLIVVDYATVGACAT
ncbi:MAG: DUF4397 domain-containing protein [Pseudomonadota bacterium]